MTSGQARPIARMGNLLSTELASGEIVVFDKERNLAHCLNPVAAVIWRACDGKRTVADLAELVATATGAEKDESVAWMGIKELGKLHLLESLPASSLAAESLTRRQALARAGAAAAAAAALVPLVSSVIAPRSAAAASCLQTNQACMVGSQCCSGNCSDAGVCI